MVQTSGTAWRPHTFRSQDGCRLFYREYGDPLDSGWPVLCLAGLTRNSKDFDAVAQQIARHGRRVLCLDYRGRGRSDYDPDWRHYTPEVYLDDIRHLLAVARAHRVVVVGTSLGGIMAMALATAMPTAIAGAVLNDVGPDIDDTNLAPIYAFLRDTAPVATWEEAAVRLRGHFGQWHNADDAAWLELAHVSCREDADGRIVPDWDPALAKPLFRGAHNGVDLWPYLRALRRLPVLIVRGQISTLLTQPTLERMLDALPLARAITVPGVGHPPTLSEPVAAAAIDAFLADL